MSSLFSTSWYRVATLRPRLRGQAQMVRHVYRGERWYVLQDLASGRFMRLNPAAYRVVALMDGVRNLDEIWRNACLTLGDDAPTQDEILQLLTQLHQANVLLTDRQPDLEELDQRRVRVRHQKIKQYFTNPLSIKIPLVDPDRFLSWIVGLLPRFTHRLVLPLWLMMMLAGVVLAALNWDELTHDITARVFTPENMLLMWLAYPVLKGIHEIGHGLAIKAYGGSCHEMGLMFLILVPVPYVDATQSAALRDKHQRMVVGAAGMMIELAVAALAIWLWSWASPGLGKAFLHQLIILAGVTTVIFNANPLIRFDGYYILADWLEIPNLGQKSNQYLGWLVNHYVFRVRDGLDAPPTTPRERAWLVFYSIASFLYRMLVSVTIVLLVAGRFFFVGIVLAAWAAYGALIAPLVKQVRYLAGDPVLAGRRRWAIGVTATTVTLLTLALVFVPAPSWTSTEGVIWMPEQSRVRAPSACFGAAVLVQPGRMVHGGEPLLACSDPELDAQVRQTRARVAELESRRALADTADRVQANIVQAELSHYRERLADLDARRASMAMIAPHDGRFAMDAPGDFAGRFLNRGDVVGFVLAPEHYTLLAVVPQGDVDLVRNSTERVELRSVDRIGELIAARIAREVPAATAELPSLALSLEGGGKIGLDPQAGRTEARTEPRALTALFQFELSFLGSQAPRNVGNRVYVRFVHANEPLATQWGRVIRQLFLKRFGG